MCLDQKSAANHLPRERFIRYENLRANVKSMALRYQSARPYPHITIPDFLDPDRAKELARNFPPPDDEAWTAYKHFNENKFGNTKRALFPSDIGAVVDELNGPEFVEWLSALTGIPGLLPDPTLEGGGMHQTPRHGFLNVHADFTMHHHMPGWRRRCNVIVYLNPDWQEAWGGAIQLWDQRMTRPEVSVLPLLNQAVIFNTTDTTYHGYPDPIQCPDGVTRKSIALYYYTAEIPGGSPARATNYRARPTDRFWRRVAIAADTSAVAMYSGMKRRLGLSDAFASRCLNWLGGRRRQ